MMREKQKMKGQMKGKMKKDEEKTKIREKIITNKKLISNLKIDNKGIQINII